MRSTETPWRRLQALLPEGRALSSKQWAARHRALTALVAVQAAALVVFALARGYTVEHAISEGGIVAVFAVAAAAKVFSPALRSCIAAVGLVMTSAVFVHLAGGVTEAHFHFFVMVAMLSLYQQWRPYLVAVAFVVVHHTFFGVIHSDSVFGTNPAAVHNPWVWASIHGLFVMAASVANLVAWRLSEHQAFHDSLTGLPNRAMFTERVTNAVSRDAGRDMVAVLFLDLDGFKAVNDSLGHAAGDELLNKVGAIVQGCIRSSDLCARLGGDEFAVLLDRVESRRVAMALAQRMIAEIAQPVAVEGGTVRVSASIGVSFSAVGRGSADDLLRNADMAMYTAKRRGKSRAEVYEPAMHAALVRRLELESDLDAAVANDELVVHYQPLVELPSRAICGFEALVRWNHPRRGLLGPADFIPLAEETGAIIDIGRFVLETATAQAAEWNSRNLLGRPLEVSVNVSALQIQDAGFAASVADALHSSGLAAPMLTLEITESVLIDDGWSMAERLDTLHGIGVSLSIDDFGTGYSSLSYLRRFPFDVLKMDRTFVQVVMDSERDQNLVAAVIQLGSALGLTVLAEGIESREQVDTLERLGCNVGQGFYFGRPSSAEEATELIRGAAIIEQLHPIIT